jgi:hypothetical protein
MASAASSHEAVISLKMNHTKELLSRYERVGAVAVYQVRHLHLGLGEEAQLRCLNVARVANGGCAGRHGDKQGKIHVAYSRKD